MKRVKIENLVGQTFKVCDLSEGYNVYTGTRMLDTTLLAWRHDLDWISVFTNKSIRVLWSRPASDTEWQMIADKRSHNLTSNL